MSHRLDSFNAYRVLGEAPLIWQTTLDTFVPSRLAERWAGTYFIEQPPPRVADVIIFVGQTIGVRYVFPQLWGPFRCFIDRYPYFIEYWYQFTDCETPAQVAPEWVLTYCPNVEPFFVFDEQALLIARNAVANIVRSERACDMCIGCGIWQTLGGPPPRELLPIDCPRPANVVTSSPSFLFVGRLQAYWTITVEDYARLALLAAQHRGCDWRDKVVKVYAPYVIGSTDFATFERLIGDHFNDASHVIVVSGAVLGATAHQIASQVDRATRCF